MSADVMKTRGIHPTAQPYRVLSTTMTYMHVDQDQEIEDTRPKEKRQENFKKCDQDQ